MVKNLIFPTILIFFSFDFLSCPPKHILAWQEEASALNTFKCPDLEIIAGITNVKLIISLTKRIEALIKQINELVTPTSNIEDASVIVILPTKENLIFELVRLLGLNSLLDNKRIDLNNFLPIRFKLLPIAIIQGYARTSHQETIRNNAFNQYSKFLGIIRAIFSAALNECQPVGLFNGLLELIFCCCPNRQKGANGKFAETLRENDLAYNVVSAIGLTFQFFVEECDRQLGDILNNYNPLFPERAYQRKHHKNCFETIAINHGFSWLID